MSRDSKSPNNGETIPDILENLKPIYTAALERNTEALENALGGRLINSIRFSKNKRIFTVAGFFAYTGKHDISDWLIQQGAYIDFVAASAVMGGYFEYTNSLIKDGADIILVAKCAAQSGHFQYVNQLLSSDKNGKYNVSIPDALEVIAQGMAEYKIDTPEKQLRALAHLAPKHLSPLLGLLKNSDESPEISDGTRTRANGMFELMHSPSSPLTYAQALLWTATDAWSKELVFILKILETGGFPDRLGYLPSLTKETFHLVFSYLMVPHLSCEALQQLGKKAASRKDNKGLVASQPTETKSRDAEEVQLYCSCFAFFGGSPSGSEERDYQPLPQEVITSQPNN